MKRALRWLGALVLLLAGLAGSVWLYAFGSNSPIIAGPLVPGVETVKDGFVSAYVIDVGPGKVALVDAGHDDDARALLAALAARDLTPASVVAIFLTHGHGDHTAGCKRFPSAAVYAMEAEVARVGDAAKVTHPLHDGEVVTVGDQPIEAFATPGHTAGSAVYFARGALFFGDSAGASKEGVVMKAVGLFSGNSGENVASLVALAKRLEPRALLVKTLAFAHTGPLTGFAPLRAFAASHGVRELSPAGTSAPRG